MSEETLLTITGVGLPLYSARGISQTLEPIQQAAQLGRTVNGGLADLSLPQFRKYRTQITCNEHNGPAMDGIWPGVQITLGCVVELSYLTAEEAEPSRDVVDGSERTEGDYTFYRPELEMRVTAYNTQKDEWGAVVSWTLEAEEV